MRYTRLYSGDDGESHFEDLEMPLEQAGEFSRVSALQDATGILFRETTGDYFIDWHNAPRRQYVIALDGQVEIEIGGGTRRRFGPGDVFLAEDTTGRGHISRAVDGRPRRSIFVPLEQAEPMEHSAGESRQ